MSLRAAQELIDRLHIRIAFEQIGENADLPQVLQERDATHYYMVMLRPGVREARIVFSVEGERPTTFPDAPRALLGIAMQHRIQMEFGDRTVELARYYRIPETQEGFQAIVDANESFKRNAEALRAFFGEHYLEFYDLPLAE
jgi:hypothetical protein